MKIKKTPLSTEIEITPDEVELWFTHVHTETLVGLLNWLRNNFGLDLFVKLKKMKKKQSKKHI